MTPSAKAATSRACAPVETPSPTAIGRSVSARDLATSSGAAELTCVRAPVTPMVEAAYRNPEVTEATVVMRTSVEDGATRKIRSSPLAVVAAIQGPASSGVRSGVITPWPPAAARRSAKRSTPYRSIGFQYDMTTGVPPAALTWATTSRTVSGVVPARRARSTAAWMSGPSMSGSE